MKLSEIRGEAAIDVIADIIDPVTEILADDEVKKIAQSDAAELTIAKVILKRQKKAILEIMAILSGEDPKKYQPTAPEILVTLVNLVGEIKANEELTSLFHQRYRMTASASFGAVTRSTEETEII